MDPFCLGKLLWGDYFIRCSFLLFFVQNEVDPNKCLPVLAESGIDKENIVKLIPLFMSYGEKNW